jgi:hypothetical protein
MELEMKKTLMAVTALVLMAVPAFAQSYDPDIGSGNITPWNDNMNRPRPNPDQNTATPYNPYLGSYDAYAQVPSWDYGYRAPSVQYDSSGYPIGPSLPDRW